MALGKLMHHFFCQSTNSWYPSHHMPTSNRTRSSILVRSGGEACWQGIDPTDLWQGLRVSAGDASFVNFTQRLRFTGTFPGCGLRCKERQFADSYRMMLKATEDAAAVNECIYLGR